MRLSTLLADNSTFPFLAALATRVEGFLMRHQITLQASTVTRCERITSSSDSATWYRAHHRIVLSHQNHVARLTYSTEMGACLSLRHMVTSHARYASVATRVGYSFDTFTDQYDASPDSEADMHYFHMLCWITDQYERLLGEEPFEEFTSLTNGIDEYDALACTLLEEDLSFRSYLAPHRIFPPDHLNPYRYEIRWSSGQRHRMIVYEHNKRQANRRLAQDLQRWFPAQPYSARRVRAWRVRKATTGNKSRQKQRFK